LTQTSRKHGLEDSSAQHRGRPASRQSREVVRRLGLLMLAWAVPGVVWFLVQADLRAVVTLTLTWALSIVHVRSLQAQVSRLDPEEPLRSGVVMLVRWGLLMVALVAVLSFGVSRPLALALGICLLPLALTTEAVLAALASRT